MLPTTQYVTEHGIEAINNDGIQWVYNGNIQWVRNISFPDRW